MLIDSFQYAFRNLLNRKLRTWLTLLGIIIGISSVIALVGLGNGLRAAVTGQFNLVGADFLTVQASGGGFGPPGQGVVDPLIKDYVDDIDNLQYVKTSFGRIIGSSRMVFNDVQQIKYIASVPDESDKLRDFYEVTGLKMESGRFLKPGETNKVVLGNDFITNEQDFGKPVVTGDRILVNDETFEVVGILKKRGSFVVDQIIFISEDKLRDLTDNTDTYSIIGVRATSTDEVVKAKIEIEKYLRKERDVKEGKENFRVQTPASTLQSLDSILAGVQIFIILIASISMIVGAIGIINTMFTAVMERTREIGIMKAIGAKNSDIFTLFVIESGLLGMVGGLVGLLFGVTFAYLGTAVLSGVIGQSLQPDISLLVVIFSLVGSFVIGTISGIIPAMQAAAMPPVRALRGA